LEKSRIKLSQLSTKLKLKLKLSLAKIVFTKKISFQKAFLVQKLG